MSPKFLENITCKKLHSIELETGTFGGAIDSKYDRVCVDLGGVHINACVKKFTLSLEGYSYVDLDFLDKLGLTEEKSSIRQHIPFSDVRIDGILGTDTLPLLFKNSWVVDPTLNIVVGNSVFGRFIFGSLLTSKQTFSSGSSVPSSKTLVISCKNKNFQLSLELLINNFFEIDKTPYEETNLTSNESNAEKLFLKHITFENNAYHISPLFNLLIPKEDLSQYMNPYRVALSHYKN